MEFLRLVFALTLLGAAVALPILFMFKMWEDGLRRPWSWWIDDHRYVCFNTGLIRSLFLFALPTYKLKRNCSFINEYKFAEAICKHKKVPKWFDQVCTKEQYDRFIETGES